MPAVSWATTSFLRATTRAISTVGAVAPIPIASQWAMVSATSALRQKHLVGIHPSCRQVPPTRRSSNRVTLSPFLAAYRAVSYPPGPAPMMIAFFAMSPSCVILIRYIYSICKYFTMAIAYTVNIKES